MSAIQPTSPHRIISSAPGKVVMAGEYAVLTGAPAIVMAVNRRARCELTVNDEHHWTFTANGFEGSSRHSIADLREPQKLSHADPARLCAWLLQGTTTTEFAALPPGLTLHTDSSAMYHGGNKLGLGSSAALITALAGALARLRAAPLPAFGAINEAHRLSQGGVGSGLDIATSLTGGTVRFQTGESRPVDWPGNLYCRFVYAGKPASTTRLVGRFNAWHHSAQKSGKTDAITALFDASATLANGGISLDNFARYISALKTLDEAATIGIYSSEHAAIATAAEHTNVLYKPCGAGGGDLGVAFSDSTDNLDRFSAEIGKNFAVIDLEIASHGLTIG